MDDHDLISEKIIGRLLETAGKVDCDDHFAIDKWEWPQGVALYALFLRWKETKDEGLLRFLRDWFTRGIDRGLPPRNVNTCAPFLTLAFLAEFDGNDQWLALCDEWAEWVMRDMPRTEERGLQHITSHLENEGELWADTLFMTVLFLAKMGVLRNRKDYRDEATYQFLLHIKYLHDSGTGLWFHGWTFKARDHFGGIRWARGNAWFTAGAPEFIEIAEPQGAARRVIEASLAAQARALERFQDESGLWHTILDDRGSYLETSASAAFAYGLLKGWRMGILDESAERVGVRAARGVLRKVRNDGVVTGVSHGTAVGMNAEHYLGIPQVPTAYGQGLAFLMLGEYAKRTGEGEGDLEIARRYAPSLLFDANEPFYPRLVGFSVLRHDGPSPSFRRELSIPKGGFVVEYAIYWDWDIGHLYDLEHIWVYVGPDGEVVDCEGSFHGRFLKGLLPDGSNLDGVRVALYSQPGKHAFAASPLVFRLLPDGDRATKELAGEAGALIGRPLEGRVKREDWWDDAARSKLRKAAFAPAWIFVPYTIPDALLIPWAQLDQELPSMFLDLLAKTRSEETSSL